MIRDVLAESARRLDQARPATVAEIRHLGRPLIAFSAEMSAADRRLKDFLFERMYRHYRVNRMTSKARRVVRQLFELLFDEPECLPPDWQARARNVDARRRARLVADYIAGMTDRFALKEHRRLFDAYE
jgi:dGTPase